MVSKKKIIGLSLILVLLVAGGFFIWNKYYRLTPPEEWDTAETLSRDTYKIKETEEGRIVENNKAGIEFKIPEGWEISNNSNKQGILIQSPDAEIKNNYQIEKGCKIGIGSTFIKTTINGLKENIIQRTSDYPMTLQKEDIILVDDVKSTKHEFKDKVYPMYYVQIHAPTKKMLHEIVLYSYQKDKEECFNKFNNVLDSISFNKK